MPPSATGFPEPLSKDRLPRELQDIDIATTRVVMAWDRDQRGVHIWLTPYTADVSRHWFMAWPSVSFWYSEFPSGYAPYSVLDTPEGLLLGCYDGQVRRFFRYSAHDGSTAVASHLTLGPLMLGPAGDEGIVSMVRPRLAAESDDVDVEVYTAVDAEMAVRAAESASSPRYTRSFSPQQSRAGFPRARGGAACVRIASDGTPWAMELVEVSREQGSFQRQSTTPTKEFF
jgi:hypothetical protein